MVRLDEYRAVRGGPNASANAETSSTQARMRHAYSPRPFAKHVGTPPPTNGRIMTYPDGLVLTSPTNSRADSDNGSYVSTESKEDYASSNSTRTAPPMPALVSRRRQEPLRPARRTTPSNHSGANRKMVTFKNAYMPDIVPNNGDYIESYDDLIYRVGGLYHTLTGFLEPDWDPEYSNGYDEDLEARSVTLMVAEFLFRSAVFLGYKPPPEQQAWLTGFRECKKFSTNDVRRWRRLAHHNWDKEERVIRPRVLPTAHARAQREKESGHHVRSKMKKLFHHHRHEGEPARSPMDFDDDLVDRHIDLDNPPMVPESIDLSQLVLIANTCVYYGSYQFSERGIRKLCNRKIDGVGK